MEVKVQTDTKVILSLSEHEAGRIMDLLISATSFEDEDWACELHSTLDSLGVHEVLAP
jgi:hypothetical protein